ncbi:MAG: enoyl-CoA hydratase/isomerase family protein, partial [Acidimicrobiales bacterium]
MAGARLRSRLPPLASCTPSERAARDVICKLSQAEREAFLATHAAALYEKLTAGYSRMLRIEELMEDAASAVPGLVPSRAEMGAERSRALADKEGVEISQGILASRFLGLRGSGAHLVAAMLAPSQEALERLPAFARDGAAEIGPVRLRRAGPAAVLELANPRHLNAEDGTTLWA